MKYYSYLEYTLSIFLHSIISYFLLLKDIFMDSATIILK